MTDMLNKVIVARFYKMNTGFFLFFFILLFGILDGKSTMQLHHSIMTGITSSFTFCLMAMLVWALYNLKCISFFLSETGKAQNSFLFNMQAFSNRGQYIALLSSQAAMFSPLLLYAAITAFTGFKEGRFLLPILFLLFQVLMCGVASVICFRRLNSTWKKPAFTLPSFNFFPRKRYSFYLLHHSLHGRKVTFAGIKLFSLLLLQTMVAANSDKLSKEAVCVLIMFLISAHAMLPVHYVRFMEQELSFARNMPIPLFKRFFVFVLTYAVIFLPELLFLLVNERRVMPLQLTGSLYAMSVSQLALYTSLQYLKGMTTDRYTMCVFVIFFITLLLLASSGLWLVFVVEGAVACGLFATLYYGYEAATPKVE